MAVRILTIAAILIALIAQPLYERIVVLGFFRTPVPTEIKDPETDVKKIPNTAFCEDVHYYHPGDVLFTSCEDDADVRFSWFPPGVNFNEPAKAGMGSLKVIDPKTFTAQTLTLEDFTAGSFVTHGIDVIADPTDNSGKTVLIYAINHTPNPEYIANLLNSKPDHNKGIHPGKSQIEIFSHVLGSGKAKHIRSIQHDSITTPNDIIAESPSSIYVTNDHHYLKGGLRLAEDFFKQAKWSHVYHIKIHDFAAAKSTPQDGIDVTLATPNMHNPNGLGRVVDAAGKPTGEILITSATSGQLYAAHVVTEPELGKNLTVEKIHQFDITVDNPSYFADPYAASSGDGDDASGYIITGLTQAARAGQTFFDKEGVAPSRTYHLKKVVREVGEGESKKVEEGYERRVLFEDDSSLIRFATAAVVTAVDPEVNGGKKEGWLWIASVPSPYMLAVKVDLAGL
ncbi:hypothetical protein KEM56_000135 [Ascosphaera pollenicola]|nr:hypothetical protein KEM56_000135 [Ascosphaera pollenicola]